MKSAKLERALGFREKEKELLTDALRRYPGESKLWIMLAQHHADAGDVKKATDTYKQAVGKCPTSVDLWCCSAMFEANNYKSAARPRSILEVARLKNPKNATLWLTAIRIEEKAGADTVAQQLMAKALQECPAAGALWAHAIASDARPLRKVLCAFCHAFARH